MDECSALPLGFLHDVGWSLVQHHRRGRLPARDSLYRGRTRRRECLGIPACLSRYCARTHVHHGLAMEYFRRARFGVVCTGGITGLLQGLDQACACPAGTLCHCAVRCLPGVTTVPAGLCRVDATVPDCSGDLADAAQALWLGYSCCHRVVLDQARSISCGAGNWSALDLSLCQEEAFTLSHS